MKNIVLFFWLISSAAFGQTYYWVGGGTDGNWTTSGNWSTLGPGMASCGACSPTTGNAVSFSGVGANGNNPCTVSVAGLSLTGISVSGYTGTITFANDLTSTGNNTITSGFMTGAGKLILNTSSSTTGFGNNTPNSITVNVEISYTGSGSGSVLFNGATFNKKVSVKKTSSAVDNGNGGNTFKDIVTLENNATNGSFGLAASFPNTFENDLTIISSASGSSTNIANNTSGTLFKGNVILNYNYSGAGAPSAITFGSSGGTSSFVGTGVMTLTCTGTQGCGDLTIAGLTYSGGLAHTFDLAQNGSTTASLILGPSSSSYTNQSSFNGSITAKAPRLFINGIVCTDASKSISFEKTQTGIDVGLGNSSFDGTVSVTNSSIDGTLRTNGNNTFNGAVTISNISRSDISLEYNNTASTYNSTLTLSNSNNDPGFGLDQINVAFTGSTTFKGDIIVKNTMMGAGIFFGASGGTSTVSNGARITSSLASTGSATSFSVGTLSITNFTQSAVSSSANDLLFTLTGTGKLQVGPNTTFAGDVNFQAPQLVLNNAVYNGSNSYFEKNNGATSSDTGSGGITFGDAATDVITIVNSSGAGLQTNGGSTFIGKTSVQNTGASYISLENSSGSTYSGASTFSNSGTANSYIQVGLSGTTAFNNDVVVNSTGAAGSFGVYFGDVAASCVGVTLADGKTITTTTFNTGELRLKKFTQGTTGVNTPQNININSAGSGGLRVGPSSTFNGDVTFSAPAILLDGCTYLGPSDNSTITKTGPSTPDSGLGGNVFSTAVTLGNIGTGDLVTATSSADTFNKTLTLNNSSSGTIRVSDVVSGTQYKGNLIINSTGSGGIYLGQNGGTSTLAGGQTIMNGNAPATTDNGTIQFKNFTQGTSSQNTAQAVTFTSVAPAYAILLLGPNSTFYGSATFTSPGLYLTGCTYKGAALLTKTGANSETSATIQTGGNIFETTATIANSGDGELRSGNPNRDIFKNDLILTNTAKGNISLAYNNGTASNPIAATDPTTTSVTDFQKTVTFNSTCTTCTVGSTTNGIYIGVGGGAGAMLSLVSATTSPLQVGTVTAGKVFLGRLWQASGVTTGLTLLFPHTTAPANNALLHTSNSYFRGDVSFKADRILLDGNTFEGNNVFTKTGTAGDDCGGGNTFTGGGGPNYSKTTTLQTTSTVTNSWAFSNSTPYSPDTFNGPLTVTNGGSNSAAANINLAHLVSGTTPTTFNNTVTFNITNTSPFITVGNGLTGSAHAGTGALFSDAGAVTAGGGQIIMNSVNGTLILGKVEIDSDHSDMSGSGGTNKSITSNTGQLTIGGTTNSELKCYFKKNAGAKQNRVTVQYSQFDGDVSIEKTGGGADNSKGGNIFGNDSNDKVKLTNSGAGTFQLANSTGDTFNGKATFSQSVGSTGAIQPAFNGNGSPATSVTNSFNSDVTTDVNNGTAITFGAGSGSATFSGNSNQTIGITGGAVLPIFKAMVMNQAAGGKVTLGTDITISGSLTFTSGVIYPGSSNYAVSFLSSATTSGATTPGPSTSFVSGPVKKAGSATFTFPIGLASGSISTCRPITISSISASDVFTAQYFKSSPSAFGTALASSLDNLSDCEYWTLTNTGGASALVGLSWYQPDCSDYTISNVTDIRVAQWNSAAWQNLGGSGSGSPTGAGTVTATSTASSGAGMPFTLASVTHATNLPIELKSFDVYPIENRSARLLWSTDSEINNHGFEIYKSVDGQEFYKIGFVEGNGTTNQTHNYSFNDLNLISKSYYKLRQLDNNGHSAYSEIRLLSIDGELTKLITVFPNPVDKSGQIILQGINDLETVRVEVLSSGGQMIKSYVGTTNEISESFQSDAVDFATGLYVMRAYTPFGQLHCKFVKL